MWPVSTSNPARQRRPRAGRLRRGGRIGTSPQGATLRELWRTSSQARADVCACLLIRRSMGRSNPSLCALARIERVIAICSPPRSAQRCTARPRGIRQQAQPPLWPQVALKCREKVGRQTRGSTTWAGRLAFAACAPWTRDRSILQSARGSGRAGKGRTVVATSTIDDLQKAVAAAAINPRRRRPAHPCHRGAWPAPWHALHHRAEVRRHCRIALHTFCAKQPTACHEHPISFIFQ